MAVYGSGIFYGGLQNYPSAYGATPPPTANTVVPGATGQGVNQTGGGLPGLPYLSQTFQLAPDGSVYNTVTGRYTPIQPGYAFDPSTGNVYRITSGTSIRPGSYIPQATQQMLATGQIPQAATNQGEFGTNIRGAGVGTYGRAAAPNPTPRMMTTGRDGYDMSHTSDHMTNPTSSTAATATYGGGSYQPTQANYPIYTGNNSGGAPVATTPTGYGPGGSYGSNVGGYNSSATAAANAAAQQHSTSTDTSSQSLATATRTPYSQESIGFLNRVLSGQEEPINRTALVSRGVDQNTSAAAAQADALRRQVAASGGSLSDPSYQAAMRRLQAGRQGANIGTTRDVNIAADQAKFAGRMSAVDALSRYDTTQQTGQETGRSTTTYTVPQGTTLGLNVPGVGTLYTGGGTVGVGGVAGGASGGVPGGGGGSARSGGSSSMASLYAPPFVQQSAPIGGSTSYNYNIASPNGSPNFGFNPNISFGGVKTNQPTVQEYIYSPGNIYYPYGK